MSSARPIGCATHSQHSPSYTGAPITVTTALRLPRTDALRFPPGARCIAYVREDRKSTRLNSSHDQISYAVFCLKKKKNMHLIQLTPHTPHFHSINSTTYKISNRRRISFRPMQSYYSL